VTKLSSLGWLRQIAGDRFAGRAVLRRTVGNSLWLFADQIFRLGVSLVVSLWVVRHLGPERYGLLNFAAAFCAPFSALLLSSMNGLLVRELVREPENEVSILGTAAVLKLAGAGFGVLVGVAFALQLPAVDSRSLPLILIVLLGSVFGAGEVSDLWFQARSRARVTAWVRSAVALLTSALKVILIVVDAPLIWFAATGTLEVALCSLGWSLALIRARRGAGRWVWDGRRAGRLLTDGWPIIVAGIAMQVQAYYDQVLLASMRSPEEVGYYAAALRLVVLFGFLPMALSTAAAPELTHAFRADRSLYLRRLRAVYRAMLGTFLVVAAPLVLAPDLIVSWAFGAKYAASAALLPLMAGRLLLTNLGIARGLHLTNEGLFKHVLVTALIGMGSNLGLNFLLIPSYGAQGCAVAALISFSINILLLEWLNPRARCSLWTLCSALGLCRLPK
jgi:O-antigen/teichoic acid export membrane protein